jgi:hypothetical protein
MNKLSALMIGAAMMLALEPTRPCGSAMAQGAILRPVRGSKPRASSSSSLSAM